MAGSNRAFRRLGSTGFAIFIILFAAMPSLVSSAPAQAENQNHRLIVAQQEAGPATTIKVRVVYADLNDDPYSVQSTFCNVNVTSATGVQEAFLDVYETGMDTGIFEGRIHLNPLQTMPSQYNNNLAIKALPGDLVQIAYEGIAGMNGQMAIETAAVKVISTDPEMRFEINYFTHLLTTFAVLLDDPDANRDPDKIDVLPLYAASTSDSLHHEVKAFETGPNTGEFRAVVEASETYSIGKVRLQNGDNISVGYEDQFPTDFNKKFADSGGDLERSTRKFTRDAVIGVVCSCSHVTPTTPRLLDAKNLPVSSASAGQQLVVAVNLANNSNAKEIPFLGIIEVRNADGVTVMFRWQSGTLAPDGALDIATSWVPEAAGDYSVRTFVVTGLRNPQVLSEVTESKVMIS